MTLPRMTAPPASVSRSGGVRSDQLGDGDVLGRWTRGCPMVAVALPVLGVVYLLTRLVRLVAAGTWRAPGPAGPANARGHHRAGDGRGTGLGLVAPGRAPTTRSRPTSGGRCGTSCPRLAGRADRAAGGAAGPRRTLWPGTAQFRPRRPRARWSWSREVGADGTPATTRRRDRGTAPGCSRSTVRPRPRRATTRRWRSTPRTGRPSTTSRSRWCGRTRGRPSTPTRRTRSRAARPARRSPSPSRSC